MVVVWYIICDDIHVYFVLELSWPLQSNPRAGYPVSYAAAVGMKEGELDYDSQ